MEGNIMSALILNPKVKQQLDSCFSEVFQTMPERYFSAPGRTEISGNHTDHQHGCVLAGAVNLDTVAAVRVNGTNKIRIQSKGYPMCEVSLEQLTPVESEINSTPALVRGVAARFAQFGCEVKGFDAYCESTVLPGSGLSSSAAYEVLIGTIINCLFFDKKLSAIEIAQVGQYAENVFFGKPCGLMDQMASSVGAMVFIDFKDPQAPVVEKIDFDFASAEHALCIIDTGADHADLTDEYAAVPGELKALCNILGEGELRSIPKMDFYSNIQRLREEVGDRAVLRAIHIYDENQRVKLQKKALQVGDFASFLSYVTESGLSSWRYLQNVIPAGRKEKQEVAFALTIAEKLLNGRGACRVHGGGFAGTIQAFVPNDLLEDFKNGIESVLGEGSCYVLSIRPQGGVEMEVEG
ncbi:MAG: galactokinase [Oscillospiraceae bacterium]|nr:galactokinase [Oscillospiraceae bacterium]